MIENYIIYCIENKINGKKYIGQTTRKLSARINSHYSSTKTKRRQCVFLQNALKKYGIANFIVTILDDSAKSQLELNKLENFYIRNNNTLFPNGYNAHYTDENFKVKVINHITRARMSKNMKRINATTDRQLINHNAGKTNLGKKRAESKIKYYGVYKRGNSFRAQFFIDYKQVHLGCFYNEIDAIITVDYFIVEHYPHLSHLINIKDNIDKYKSNSIPKPTSLPTVQKCNSKYYGVGFSKIKNKWRARLAKYKKFDKLIGFFNTEIEAAIAYNNKVKELNLSMPINDIS
jgi:group I intron endonuclease